jgi:hypothetical protein
MAVRPPRRYDVDDAGNVRDVVPSPDPTRLTTTQLLREVLSTRELLEAKIGALDGVVRTKLEAVERADEARIKSVVEQTGEKFASVALQFVERDERARAAETAAKDAQNALSVASTTAVNAALQAQKESAFATQQSNAEAIRKSELNFADKIKSLEALLDAAKQGFTGEIRSLQTLIDATKDGLATSINELRSRIDRGEGGQQGAQINRDNSHASVNQTAIIIGVIISAVVGLGGFAFGISNMRNPAPVLTAPAVVPLAH